MQLSQLPSSLDPPLVLLFHLAHSVLALCQARLDLEPTLAKKMPMLKTFTIFSLTPSHQEAPALVALLPRPVTTLSRLTHAQKFMELARDNSLNHKLPLTVNVPPSKIRALTLLHKSDCLSTIVATTIFLVVLFSPTILTFCCLVSQTLVL